MIKLNNNDENKFNFHKLNGTSICICLEKK